MGERTETICPPLNEHEAAIYDRFVQFLIEHEKREELEAEVRRLKKMLRLAVESGINAVAPTEEQRLAMVREVAEERLADLARRVEEER